MGVSFPLTCLQVRACNKMRKLFSRELSVHLPNLERLEVGFCSEMEEIIGGGGEDEGRSSVNTVIHSCPPSSPCGFPNLKRLHLKDLPQLKSIFEGMLICGKIEHILLYKCPKLERVLLQCPRPLGFPSPLIHLEVYGCHKMRKLFSRELSVGLPNLKSLEVRSCKGMEEIIGGGGEDEGRSSVNTIIHSSLLSSPSSPCGFPNLKRLHLKDLPQLKSIFEGMLICSKIEHILLYKCPKLERVPLQCPRSLGFPSPLIHLEVYGCHKMKKLFSRELSIGLPNLKSLEVRSSKGMEEIIGGGGGEAEGRSSVNTIIPSSLLSSPSFPCGFPNLKRLHLKDLPQLKSIFEGMLICGKIEHILLYKCPKLERVLLQCPHPLGFPSPPIHLEVYGCHKMRKLFSRELSIGLPNLESLEVRSCKGMEEIIGGGEDEGRSSVNTIIHSSLLSSPSSPCGFPNLKRLHLEDLPQLKNIPDGMLICDKIKRILLYKCPKLERVPLQCPRPLGFPFPLIHLEVYGCHKMRKLFSRELSIDLPNLKSLKVTSCKGMEEIIGRGGGEDEGRSGVNTIIHCSHLSSPSSPWRFPNLKNLILRDLPQLKSICEGMLIYDKIECIQLTGCPKLERVPLQCPPPPSLRVIKISRMAEWESLEWGHPSDSVLLKDRLRPFVHWCPFFV